MALAASRFETRLGSNDEKHVDNKNVVTDKDGGHCCY